MNQIAINRYRITKKALAEALKVLQAGGAVAFPTETAYGLAADSGNTDALKKIYAIKGRPKDKRLPLLAADLNQVRHFFSLNKAIVKVTEKHWPGPLTVILKPGGSSVLDWPDAAVRVSSARWPQALAEALGRPITATSANLSGRPATYTGLAVRRQFAGQPKNLQPDLLLDAGRLPQRPPSTIIRPDPVQPGGFAVLRQGAIRIE